MSQREQSFMKALFHGVVAEELLYPYPKLGARDRDGVSSLLEALRRFAERYVDSGRFEREHTINDDALEALKRTGVFGLTVPEEYGGLGLGQMATARVLQELGMIDASIAALVTCHICMGVSGILAFGSAEQKKRFLPAMASGERIAAFALTEERAGSDASAIATRATFALDGAGFVLEGQKLWISNAKWADLFITFARTDLEAGHPRITAFIVERGPGVVVGGDAHTAGLRGSSTASVWFDSAKVPFRNLLGELGRGYLLAMRILNWARVGHAAACVGIGKRIGKLATDRAVERRAFGRPIGDFGQTKDAIARIGCENYAMESMVFLTTGLMDIGVEDFILEAAICKVFASENVAKNADLLCRIGGAHGYIDGHVYDRVLRDARGHLVLAGTNEILRAFVALAGMQSPGRKVLEVDNAMREPIKGFGVLTDFAVKRARSAFGRERVSFSHPALRGETVLFEDGVNGLAREAERVLRKHGTAIAQKQFVQRRIAECAIDLFALAAVLSRTTAILEQRGEEGARRELDLATGFTQIVSARLFDRLNNMERETDELLKHIAARAYDDGGFPNDIMR